MSISVIIPTYNRVNTIKRTFEHIAKSTVLPGEVIVVDQTSNPDLQSQIRDICSGQIFPVRYVYQDIPSLTKARNNGLNFVSNETVVFMDDDVDVQKETFANLESLFKDANLAMVGGFDSNTVLHNSFLGYLFGKSSYRKRFQGHVTKAMYGRFPLLSEPAIPTEWAMGFFFAVRRSCLNRWGLRFDERLKHYAYAEDLDFTYAYYKHASTENMHCITSSDATVAHNYSKEYRIPSKSATYMQLLHREYLRYKHFGSISSSIVMNWSNMGDFIYRLIHRQQPWTVFQAQLFLMKHCKDIRRGEFHYESFM